MKHGFSGFASKLVVMVCPWFGLKAIAMVSWFGPQNQGPGLVIWASKSPRQFLDLGPKTKCEEVCQFVPQNR
jgi:hypothetical protein